MFLETFVTFRVLSGNYVLCFKDIPDHLFVKYWVLFLKYRKGIHLDAVVNK